MRTYYLKSRGLKLALAAGLLAIPVLAVATPTYYHTTFTTLNDSGVTGTANLTLDMDANTLLVHINATGLMPGMPHPQHIHGTFGADGTTPSQTVTPTLAANDTNGDGVIELLEGATTYGAILLPLTFSMIVLHGMNVRFALTDGGVDYAKGEYDPVLPLASGVIMAGRLAVPEPSSFIDMLAGLGALLALVGFGRRRLCRDGKTC